MTPTAIWNEYLAREADANKRPEGADVEAIIRKIAADAGMTYDDVREVVISRTHNRSCG